MTVFKSTCHKCDKVFNVVKERGKPITGCPHCGVPMQAVAAFSGQNRHARRAIALNKKRLRRASGSLDTPPEPDQAA